MSKLITLDRPDYVRVVELAASGHSESTIAEAIFVSPRTFRHLKQRDPLLVEALELGRGMEHDALVSRLRRLADDGNVVALLFLLKTRHGYKEGSEVGATQAVAVNIVLPDAMTREQFARAVDVKVLPKDDPDE